MAITSLGIGSGLKLQEMVDKMVALEKKPLQQLQVKASGLSASVSAYGQLKSQIANLQTQASALAQKSTWDSKSISSSNSAMVSGVAEADATANTYTVSVTQLARAQATGSDRYAKDFTFDTGTLSIATGTWGEGNSFEPGKTGAVDIKVAAGDTLAQVAAKINRAGAGVTATVLSDAQGDRLLMTSSKTGSAEGFSVTSGDETLSGLRYNPADAGVTGGMTLTATALDAKAKINGVEVVSGSNKFDETITGLVLTVSQLTMTGEGSAAKDTPVIITVKGDSSVGRKAIDNFISSFNAITAALSSMTSYDEKTKTAGTLQGDGTAVNLQKALRSMLTSPGVAGSFGSLTELGVEFQKDGSLKVNEKTMAKALESPEKLKAFFATASDDNQMGGFGVRLNEFTTGLLNVDGMFFTKNESLEKAQKNNAKDQDNVIARADRFEERMNKQYSALDSKLGKLSLLNDYVVQQITTWNKNT